MSDGDDHDVGFRKPPREHRFKKGVSGNPRGRPKRTRNIDTLIDRELDQAITLKEAGQEVRLRKREAIVKRLVNNALKGDTRSIEYLVKYSRENGAGDPFVVTDEDAAEFRAAVERHSGLGSGIEDEVNGNGT